MDLLGDLQRTHDCGTLSIKNKGEHVVLMGWVDRRRDHGGVIFVDLRDRNDRTQVVFNPQHSSKVHEKAENLRNEWVIAIEGTVQPRPEGMTNPKMATGEIEVMVDSLLILNASKTPPLLINETSNESEDLRLRYRYLDLRRPWTQKRIFFRHQVIRSIREYLDGQGFIDVETPILMKSTPEGARDFLVPSRVNKGNFYALPQSPQTYKQILMVAGFERYYQIAKCFRDEDLRADRQPEFTQIDCEMSFVTAGAVMEVMEGMVKHIFSKNIPDFKAPEKFPVISYREAMEKYGCDNPDVRFGLELSDVTDLFSKCSFKVFLDIIKEGGIIKGICARKCGDFSRKVIDDLTGFVGKYDAKGLVWMRVTDKGVETQIAKFLSPEILENLGKRMKAEQGDMLFLVAGPPKIVNQSLSNLRLEIARRKNLIDSAKFEFTWVVDFPMFEYSEEYKKYTPSHHPFTSPLEEDIPLLDGPEYYKARAKAYDLVLNGNEIGGGSIRIHNRELQQKIFKLLDLTPEQAKQKFGFLLEAFEYGAPPHGGIAFGLDRIIMLMVGVQSIREVIAFPKTSNASSLMDGSPSPVDKEQLDELGIRIIDI
jgi:aspartyl-tRNA synthetase